MRRKPPRLLLAAGLVTALAATVGTATGAAPSGPRYANHPGPALTASAGEPSIGVNWKTGAAFLQAGTQTAKVVFDSAGEPTWSRVTSSTTGITTFDPIAASDNTTGRVFVSQLVLAGSLMAYTDNDGASWSMSQGSGIPAGVDHQTVGAGPYPPEGGAGPLTTYPNAVYYCSQDIGTAMCARSDTGGLTFGAGVPTYTLAQCAGLHGHVRVSPDGTVYLPNKSCGGMQGVAVSTDAGVTWTVRTVPGSRPGKGGDPSLAAAKDGTSYLAYVDATGQAMVSVTSNKGAGWSLPVDIGAKHGVKNAVIPSAIVGDGDRAAVAFLGTKTEGNAQDQYFGMDPSHTRYVGAEYHLYIATTTNRGKSWTTVDATGADPVQRGRVCMGGAGCTGGDRNLLDFMGIQVDRSGRVLVGWADGCVLTCVTSDLVTANTHTDAGTITRQVSGPRLFRKTPAVQGG